MKNYKTYLNESVELNKELEDLIRSATLTIDTDDLDEAAFEIQTLINQDTGDNAAMYFSDLANDEEDAIKRDEEWWGSLTVKRKIKRMWGYLNNEIDSYEYEDDTKWSLNSKGEYLNIINGGILYYIYQGFSSNSDTTLSDRQKEILIIRQKETHIKFNNLEKIKKRNKFNL